MQTCFLCPAIFCPCVVEPSIDSSPEFKKAASQTGRTGRLICRAEGAPTVTFQWQKVDAAFTTHNVIVLVISPFE